MTITGNGIAAAAIGIDLGTTYSCVSVFKHSLAETIVNGEGKYTTPSLVAFTNTDIRIGDDAEEEFIRNPTNTVYSAKRLLGRKFSDFSIQSDRKLWPFKVVQDSDGKPVYAVNYKGREEIYHPEEISYRILAYMKEIAEARLGYSVTKAVVTVPAHFNDSQRQATKTAAEMAGFLDICLLDEPEAAATAYGLHMKKEEEKNVLIFDFGGGTLDVSLLEMRGGNCMVKAEAGDAHLGGEDIDNRIVRHLMEEFRRKHNCDMSEDPIAVRKLKAVCETKKRRLSYCTKIEIYIECLYKGLHFDSTITREKFNELNMDLFSRGIRLVEKCLKDAKMDKGSVDEVVLVGGSTRIPRVQSMLGEFFNGKKLCKSINADQAISWGAAMKAADMLKGNGVERLEDLSLIALSSSVDQDQRIMMNDLVDYVFQMKKLISDKNAALNLDSNYKVEVRKVLDQVSGWTRDNQGAEKQDIENKSNFLKAMCYGINSKIHNLNIDKSPKAMVSKIHFKHDAGHIFKWMEGAKGSYTCDACKRKGRGSRYRCESCDDFKLHKDCLEVIPVKTHELTGSEFEFVGVPRNGNQCCTNCKRKCNACREIIDKVFYLCEEKNIALHPVCFNLAAKIQIDGVDFKLSTRGSKTKCTLCRRKKLESEVRNVPLGWSYISEDEESRIHFSCALELLLQCNGKEDVSGNELIIQKLENCVSKRKGRWKKGSKFVSRIISLLGFLGNIFGVGDPFSVIALVVEHLWDS